MMQRSSLQWPLALGLSAMAIAACLPEISYNDDSGVGAGTTTTTTTGMGGAAVGGASTTTSMTTTASMMTTTTAVGGMGGAATVGGNGGGGAGGPCDITMTGQCGGGMKCSVVNQDLGLIGGTACVSAGAKVAWDVCSSDGQCREGLWCDEAAEVCRPVCTGLASDCGMTADATCLIMRKDNMPDEIPGLGGCTGNCDPLSGASCGASATCDYIILGSSPNDVAYLDCRLSKNAMLGASCNESGECALGLTCVGGPLVCFEWCQVGQSNCPLGQVCSGFVTPITRAGVEYGVCN